MEFLESVAAGGRIAGRVALVLAHPDDETASAGALLQRLASPRLIYLTDGAPRDMADARRAGFGDWRGYAELRKRELAAALASLGVPVQVTFYDCADKQSLEALPILVERLAEDLAGAAAVVTHAYEHGHPDHDTAALAVAMALQRLGGAAPPAFEFAGYRLGPEGPVYGRFFGEPGGVALDPSGREAERKRGAIAAYRSQRETLALFPLAPERFRPAARYDFAAPAPPGRALYDLYGWNVTSRQWRDRVADLLVE